MAVTTAAAKPIPRWREPTKDQWLAWWAAWLGWTLDAFDFLHSIAGPHPAERFELTQTHKSKSANDVSAPALLWPR